MIVADRWKDDELREALARSRFPLTGIVWRGQGFLDGSADVEAFRRACLDGKVTPVPSLLLRQGMYEARTVCDTAGNEKLAKSTQGGRRERARDDAVASAILAIAEGSRRTRGEGGGVYLGVA